jgi:hypothetical protein
MVNIIAYATLFCSTLVHTSLVPEERRTSDLHGQIPKSAMQNQQDSEKSVFRTAAHDTSQNFSRMVEFELDKYGILIKLSIVLSLVILIIGAGTVLSTFVCGCMEGIRRRKRIKQWESSRKGVSSPKKYTQSIGEPETDIETIAGG